MGKLIDVLKKIRAGLVGFHANEVMTGTHEFEPGCGPAGRRFMQFRVKWGTSKLADWLRKDSGRFLTNDLEGTVTIDGLCTDAPCKGDLELRYFDLHKIRYLFTFEVGGVAYRYVGEKVNIMPWNLPFSHTTCFGRLTEVATGKLVSTSVTFFRFSTVLQFATSLRFAMA